MGYCAFRIAHNVLGGNMTFKGTLKGVLRDFKTGRINVQFEVIEGNVDEIEALADKDLEIEAKKYRKKRSKDANALLWACIGELSKALHADKWDIYLTLLKRYGKYTYICVKPNVVDAVKAQWRETEEIGEIEINGTKAIQLLCYFGSHTYNTKEFSRLLEGTIEEMAAAGLQRPTSEEMQRSLEAWEKSQL